MSKEKEELNFEKILEEVENEENLGRGGEIELNFERPIVTVSDGLYLRIPNLLVRRYGLEKRDYVVANLKVLKGIRYK